MNLNEGTTSITLGKQLPQEIASSMLITGAGTLIDLPRQLLIMGLNDFRESDIADFEGPARFRVGVAESFMLISPAFKKMSFDIIWSPLIAQMSGEPAMDQPDPEQHALFNFVLIDDKRVVRSIRSATISAGVATAIWRARGDLAQRKVSGDALQSEMIALFSKYPQGIPEGFFHEVCEFGD